MYTPVLDTEAACAWQEGKPLSPRQDEFEVMMPDVVSGSGTGESNCTNRRLMEKLREKYNHNTYTRQQFDP